jgi:uncharacterized protein
MTPTVKMLQIYVDETDLWGTGKLYEAIVRRVHQLQLNGATVTLGTMGYGIGGRVHHKHLFGVSDDKPAIVTVVDEERKIRAALPEIRSMVKEGLVLLVDVEVIPPAPEANE